MDLNSVTKENLTTRLIKDSLTRHDHLTWFVRNDWQQGAEYEFARNRRFGLTGCDSRGKVRSTRAWQAPAAVSTASSLARQEGKSRFATGTGSRPRVYVYIRVETRDATYVIASPADRILDRRGAARRVVTTGEQGRRNNRKPAGRIDMCTRAALDRILTCRALVLSLSLALSSSLSPLCWNLRLDSWHSHMPFSLVFAANEAKMEKSMCRCEQGRASSP